MNSLPFISHHLFVAAIGNESRAAEKAIRREKRTAISPERLGPIGLELINAVRRPAFASGRSVEAGVAQPGA
jgi:hypothetical protein